MNKFVPFNGSHNCNRNAHRCAIRVHRRFQCFWSYSKKQIYHLFPEYYLIRINNFNDIAVTPLDEWIYFLKNEAIKDEFKAK
jgi:hypothetical protein